MGLFRMAEWILDKIDVRYGQKLRRFEHEFDTGGTYYVRHLIECEEQLLKLSQREVFLEEEIYTAQKQKKLKPLTPKQDSRLKRMEDELAAIGKKYWLAERALYRVQQEERENVPWVRIFETERRVPNLVELKLRNDCAGRGGCCGRACGCCQRPRKEQRVKGLQHCSIACGCCVRDRGFYLP